MQQFARQALPGPLQQRGGALLLVQTALRGQPRLRGGDALAMQCALLGKGFTHALARVGMSLGVQRGSATPGLVEDPLDLARAVGLDQVEQGLSL